MQGWDYLIFAPLMGAGFYLWRRSRSKKSSCSACNSCPTQSCKK